MKRHDHLRLSKREREIMDILIRHSKADVAEVVSHMHDPCSYSSIRKILTIMFEKGLLVREKVGKRHVYSPAIRKEEAEATAVSQLLRTYFDDSLESAVSALLRFRKSDLDEEYLERLKGIIDRYKTEEE